MNDHLPDAQVTNEFVAERPSTMSWDTALRGVSLDESRRREIIRLIGLEEMPDETVEFFVCFKKHVA